MENKNIIVFGLLSILIIGLYYYNTYRVTESNPELKVEIYTQNSKKVDDFLNLKKYILYYYSGNDCNTCVVNGFNIINKLGEGKKLNIKIFSKNNNPENDEKIYNPKYKIILDKEGKLYKIMHLLHTPFLAFKRDTSLTILKIGSLEEYYRVADSLLKIRDKL